MNELFPVLIEKVLHSGPFIIENPLVLLEHSFVDLPVFPTFAGSEPGEVFPLTECLLHQVRQLICRNLSQDGHNVVEEVGSFRRRERDDEIFESSKRHDAIYLTQLLPNVIEINPVGFVVDGDRVSL